MFRQFIGAFAGGFAAVMYANSKTNHRTIDRRDHDEDHQETNAEGLVNFTDTGVTVNVKEIANRANSTLKSLGVVIGDPANLDTKKNTTQAENTTPVFAPSLRVKDNRAIFRNIPANAVVDVVDDKKTKTVRIESVIGSCSFWSCPKHHYKTSLPAKTELDFPSNTKINHKS